MIERFVKFKDPVIIEDSDNKKGGIIFRTHVVMTDGRNLLISDARHGDVIYAINETLVFPCDEEGNITEWCEVEGGRFSRTEEIINRLNSN
jgi:hypothetical protein